MIVTDEEYAQAIRTVYEYRKERDLFFVFPMNVDPIGETITMEQFKLWLSIQEFLKKP
jgi:hypothetical protein